MKDEDKMAGQICQEQMDSIGKSEAKLIMDMIPVMGDDLREWSNFNARVVMSNDLRRTLLIFIEDEKTGEPKALDIDVEHVMGDCFPFYQS